MKKKIKEFNYRSPVGSPNLYDFATGVQFCLLFNLGMRSYHKVLDFGCGSLRLGRFLIQYLDRGNYYGIEPNKKLLMNGINGNHLNQLCSAKKPNWHISADCDMFHWKQKFDFIIAHLVYTHLPLEMVRKSLKTAYMAMDRKSIFITTYFEGEEDNQLEQFCKKGIFYKKETMEKSISRARLNLIQLNVALNAGQTFLLLRRN